MNYDYYYNDDNDNDNNNKDIDNKVKKMKIIMLISVIIIIVAGIFAYKEFTGDKKSNNTSKQGEVNKTPTPKPTATPKPKSNVKIIDIYSNTRPYAVMINCHNEALPQSGLQDAYMVYEIMVEYGITRMMAFFKDIDFNKVGSIRSLRNQYIGYALEQDAVIVHAGGSSEATGRLSREKINHIDVDGKYGQRDKTLAKKRAWEHTLFTKTSSLSQAMNDYKLRKTTTVKNLLTYSEKELDLSKYKTKSAKDISIKYSNYRTSKYKYDSSSKKYLRFIGSRKDSDLVTGKQMQVKNIIVYGVKYSTYKYGNNKTPYAKVHNIGTGEGYYITNGVALPITWSKADEKSQTVYKIKETGEKLVVNDGNTYIQIYPTNGGKLTIK